MTVVRSEEHRESEGHAGLPLANKLNVKSKRVNLHKSKVL